MNQSKCVIALAVALTLTSIAATCATVAGAQTTAKTGATAYHHRNIWSGGKYRHWRHHRYHHVS